MGDLALGAALALVVLLTLAGLVAFILAWWPAPRPEDEPLEKLARQLVRVADERDAALTKLDEVAQRLSRCTCGVGAAVAAELDNYESERA